MKYLGRFKYITSHNLFSFLVFAIYNTNAKKKRIGRTVVNICKLNNLVILDVYLLSLQSDIIASVLGSTNLTILDAASFFYQWLFYLDHWYIFSVVTY